MLSIARSQRLVSSSLSSLLVTALAACSSNSDQPNPEEQAAPPAGSSAPAAKPAAAAAAAAPAEKQSSGTQELVQQKQQMLVKTALDNAAALREQGKYDEARAQLEQVLQMDPGNTQALVAYNEIQQLQGERSGDIQTTGDTVRQRITAKAQALKL
jgi:tetratricopeptide (TPR) repeat protein